MRGFYAIFVLFCVLAATVIANAKKWDGRPDPFRRAAFARYMIRNADWGVLSAYSPKFQQPYGTLASFADGPIGDSSGWPYFYVAKISTTWANIKHNNTVSFHVSEAQGDHCADGNIDPMEPTCARLMLTGDVIVVTDPDEKAFAKRGLFTRHPAMKGWPKKHGWHVMKLDIKRINLLSYYGGAANVPLDSYFSPAFWSNHVKDNVVPAVL